MLEELIEQHWTELAHPFAVLLFWYVSSFAFLHCVDFCEEDSYIQHCVCHFVDFSVQTPKELRN